MVWIVILLGLCLVGLMLQQLQIDGLFKIIKTHSNMWDRQIKINNNQIDINSRLFIEKEKTDD